MKITEISVKKPVLIFVVYIFILIISIISLTKLPVDLFPDIEFPALTVLTPYPNSSAQDVEEKVTKVIESAVSSVPGIDTIESTSQENLSVVVARFKWGTNIDAKAGDLRDLLEFVKIRLPDDVEKPRIIKFDFSASPVMILAVNSKEKMPDLRYFVDKNIVDELKKIDGVGGVFSRGGSEREVSVIVSAEKLAFYRISLQQIISSIASENLDMPLGRVYEGYKKYELRLAMKFKSVDEIKNLVVGNISSKPVYLYQVAEVVDGHKEIIGATRENGKDSVIIIVRKKAGENTVYVCNNINKQLKTIRKRFPKLNIDVVMDSSEYILKVVSSLKNTILLGGILVILTVLFFVADIFPAIVVVLQIPISLLVSFIFLYIFGFTINMISLISLSIAVGMVVDNSIVVVDHILRHLLLGKDSKTAAIDATGEVGSAIIASTLTTIVIFVPLLFVSGLLPVLFKQLAYSIIIVLFSSLFVAFTLTPMLMSKFCSEKECEKKSVVFVSSIIEKIEIFYNDILSWGLKNRKTVLFVFLGLFFMSLVIFIFFTGKEFLPKSDEATLTLNFEGPKGMQVKDTIKLMEQIESEIYKVVPQKFVDKMFSRCGESDVGGLGAAFGQKELSNTGTIMLRLVEKNKRTMTSIEIGEILRNRIRQIPGIINLGVNVQSSASGALFGGGKTVSIELRGNDLETGLKIAQDLKTKLSNIEGIRDTTISLEKGSPEIWVELNREKIKFLGLSTYAIGDTLRKLYYGSIIGKYRPQRGSFVEDEYDIFVRLSQEDKSDIKNLQSLPILLPSGKIVPLNNFAEFKKTAGPEEILRKDGVRIIKIEAETYGKALSKIRQNIEKMLSETNLPYGFDIKFGGEIKEQQSAFRDLTLMLFLGIVLVYLIMAGQFGSWLDPFIIMFSIPFAVTGVLIGVFLWGQNFGIMTFVGLLILVGVVVNNAIVLVDYINLLRSRGIEIFEAIKTAGKTRLKPILMTSITTILGSLPMALSKREGAEYFSSMGVSLIGGLTFSTMITLIFVPVLYSVIHTKYIKNKNF